MMSNAAKSLDILATSLHLRYIIILMSNKIIFRSYLAEFLDTLAKRFHVVVNCYLIVLVNLI